MNCEKRNYYLITMDFFRYLPSRFYVLSTLLLIIPLFAKMLSVKEMGQYQIGISLLNLICTIFFDWISKAVLRFRKKAELQGILTEFTSSIYTLFMCNYLIMLLLYFILKQKICAYFFIDEMTLLSVMILVIPCLIRQFLYQLLRLLDKPFLYTFSIVFYQILLVLMTMLCIKKGTDNVSSILISMAIAITITDCLIITKIKPQKTFSLKFIKIGIIQQCLKYGLPLICTNFCIWGMWHLSQYYYQSQREFESTGEIAISNFIAKSILTAIFSTFLFSVFPRIIKKYETQKDISSFMTSLTQLYCIYFLPLTMIFCFYPQSIIGIFTHNQYHQTIYLIPFFALSIFLHELTKIINVKYHLKNKTYIETIISIFTIICGIIINLILINLYGITGAAAALLISFIIYAILNACINFKDIKYINYGKVSYTFIFSLVICFISYFCLHSFELFITGGIIFYVIKILLFLIISYALTYISTNLILK